jgi:NADH-quinone oxidoreductase subunit L
VLAAFVTAFYVARLWFRVFTGPEQTEGLREGHRSMLLPMGVLGAITAVIGFTGPAIGRFLGHEIPWPEPATAALSTSVAGAGLALGWFVYGRRSRVLNTRVIQERIGFAYDVLVNKLYLDLTYQYFVVRPYAAASQALAVFDGSVIDGVVNGAARAWTRVAEASRTFDVTVVDGLVNGAAVVVKEAGATLRRIQTGRVRAYQMLVVGAVVALVVWVLVKGA